MFSIKKVNQLNTRNWSFVLTVILVVSSFSLNLSTALAAATVLHTFGPDYVDGASPYGDLLEVSGKFYGLTYQGGYYGNGTLFSVNPDGSEYETLHNFGAQNDGKYPQGSLIYHEGKLFGVTSGGGSDHNNGTIFSLDPDGSNYTVVYDGFDYNNTGSYLTASLVVSDGKLYGVTYNGGTHEDGTIFSVNTNGAGFTTLHHFNDNADGKHPKGAMAASDGVLYGMTSEGGGAGSYGTLFSFDTNANDGEGEFVVLDRFDSDGEFGANPGFTSLLLIENVLYGVTEYGGEKLDEINSQNQGVIFSFDLNTPEDGLQNLHTFQHGVNGAYPEGSLIFFGDKFYGMTRDGGPAGGGVVFSIDPDGNNFSVLRNFGSEGFGDEGEYGSYPRGSLILSGGKFYGMTVYNGLYGDGTIFSLTADGENIEVLHNFSDAVDETNGKNPIDSIIRVGNVLYGMVPQGGENGSGVIFSINVNGTGYTVLHSFESNKGNPYGSLTSLGGKLYGLTYSGSEDGAGSIFSININGTGFQYLHYFNYEDDGADPSNSLVADGTKLYGVTSSGGEYGNGTIFYYETSGDVFNVLHHLDNSDPNYEGGYAVGDLVISDGVIYGMTSEGGEDGAGNIFKINIDGTNFETLHYFDYETDGGYPYGGLIISDGVLYGMTIEGGEYEYGTIFSYDLNANEGERFNVLHDFDYDNDGGGPEGSLVLVGGRLYGMTPSGGNSDSEEGVLFVIDSNGENFEVINLFDPYVDGESPYGSLIYYNGNLYGMTNDGGPRNGQGTIFRFAIEGGGDEIISAPSLTTQNASSITRISATLNGTITATNGANATTRGFHYGTTDSYGQTLSTSGSYGNGAYSIVLTGLTCGTNYYFRAFATNSGGTTATLGKSFNTSACTSGGGGSSGYRSVMIPAPATVAPIPTTPVTSPTFTRNLETGSSGNDVKELQKFLNANGFIVAPTGPGSIGNETNLFGVMTRAALARFQAVNGIVPAAGFFGPVTRAFIENMNGSPVTTPVIPATIPLITEPLGVRDLDMGMTGADVTALQNLLMAQGYTIPAGVTGFFATQTRDALAKYQAANVITPSVGYFGVKTRTQMKSAGLSGLWWQ
ncbi:MAG TPA: peptidoglycan-binding protein [Candidatus Paceibacterota bacterium]|nr:peptidoglycan-binding protein [Candidatus Paceibacterota bacterium]